MTQLIKRSPVNLRPLLGIKKALNAKGVALAARAIILLANRHEVSLPLERPMPEEYEQLSDDETGKGLQADFDYLAASLLSFRSQGFEEACWGYNFDWQSRAFFAPRGTPNAVCTVFAAHAFLDWFEKTGSDHAFDMAESSCRFILDRLNRTGGEDEFCFSYTPLDNSRVHNVNMLAAELLARVFGINQKEEYRETAARAVRFTMARQLDDGAWPYGEAENQRWIDGFHTGFVLVSLKNIIGHLGETGWRSGLRRGCEYYRERFFLADSAPKYYHDRLYPVDVHSAAQAIITFAEMKDIMPGAGKMANQAVKWAIDNMQDEAGYFYFQRHRFYTIKIPYMRWAQTWMLYALSLYLSRGMVSEDV